MREDTGPECGAQGIGKEGISEGRCHLFDEEIEMRGEDSLKRLDGAKTGHACWRLNSDMAQLDNERDVWLRV
jgi:hypothetical protein